MGQAAPLPGSRGRAGRSSGLSPLSPELEAGSKLSLWVCTAECSIDASHNRCDSGGDDTTLQGAEPQEGSGRGNYPPPRLPESR